MLSAVVTVAVLVGYVVSVGVALWKTIAASGAAPSFSDAFLYIATALAGFVGGIVAFEFGVSDGSGSRRTQRFGRILWPKGPAGWQNAIGGLYAITYVVLGIATIALGLFIGIASAFLRRS